MFDFGILAKWAQDEPNGLAFADDEYVLSFPQLNSLALKTAAHLTERGIVQGDLVCVALPSYLEWSTTLALHLLGAKTMSKIGPGGFNPEVFPDWLITLQLDPEVGIERTIIFDEALLATVVAGPEMKDAPGYSHGSDIVRFFSTSGTTGSRKYFAVTSDGLASLVGRSGKSDFAGEDPLLSLFPFAMGANYLRALRALVAGKPYFTCSFRDYRLTKMLRKYPIRTLLGSPVQIANFLNLQMHTDTQLPNLKTIVMSGSTPSSKLLARINSQIGCEVLNGYGSAEAGNVAISTITQESSIPGVINPAVTLQIVDEANQILPAGAIGSIRYSREGMALSYYNNPEASAEYFREGFFYPGDLGFIDTQGRLVLAGRSNEVINLGGVKVNPENVDEIAMAQLGVLDCAAFAIMSQSGVDQLALALVTDKDFDLALFKKTMENKSIYPPTLYFPTKSIPRNENGKILREELRESVEKK